MSQASRMLGASSISGAAKHGECQIEAGNRPFAGDSRVGWSTAVNPFKKLPPIIPYETMPQASSIGVYHWVF